MNEYMEKIAEEAYEDELEKLGVSPQTIGRALAGRRSILSQILNAQKRGYNPGSVKDMVASSVFAHKIALSKNPLEQAKALIKETQKSKPNINGFAYLAKERLAHK